MKHTPGPWKINPHASRAGGEVYIDSGGKYVVADVGLVDDLELISAAPDLLAAARSALECLSISVMNGDPWREEWKALTRAIAKAEGINHE